MSDKCNGCGFFICWCFDGLDSRKQPNPIWHNLSGGPATPKPADPRSEGIARAINRINAPYDPRCGCGEFMAEGR